jgi:4-hydroxyphenylacetate 3-monooxygenase
MPNAVFVTAGRAYSVEHYRRIIGLLQDVGSQPLVNIPTEGMLDKPVLGPRLEEMLAGPMAPARDRAQVTRLAIDLVADSYGGRQTPFELFNALPWTNQRDQLVMRFDVEPCRQLARAVAGSAPLDDAAEAVAIDAGAATTSYDAVGQMYGRRWSPTAQSGLR